MEVNLGPEARGQTVRVRLGDVIAIRVAETPTTGYRWVLADPPPSTLVLENRYEPPSPATPGAPGVRLLRLRAQRPGMAVVRLTKRRPWAAADIGEDLVVTIQISDEPLDLAAADENRTTVTVVVRQTSAPGPSGEDLSTEDGDEDGHHD